MDEIVYRRPDKVLVYLYRRAPTDVPEQGSAQGRQSAIEYLLLQRQAQTTNAGGIWQTVVGGVRWNEERIEAVRREVFEETGLTLLQGITAIGYAFSFPISLRKNQTSWYPPGVTAINNIVYAGEVVSTRPVQLCPEHVAYGWFSYLDAFRSLHWPEEKEALSRLHPLIGAETSPNVALQA